MTTRLTHARIYQHELSGKEYDRLKRIAWKNHVSIKELIVAAIKYYLKDYFHEFAVQDSFKIEEVWVDEQTVRFFLWIPYSMCNGVEQFMKEKQQYIQELTCMAIHSYLEKGMDNNDDSAVISSK